MNLREAAQQALELFEEIHPGNMTPMAEGAWNTAITALRAALAEDAMQRLTDVQQMIERGTKAWADVPDATGWVEEMRGNVPAPTSQESRQVEPVAWLIESYDIYAKRTLQRLVFDNPKNMQGVKITAYYTAPPQRKPLSEEQIEFRFGKKPTRYMLFLIRSTERAHGIGGEE
jgi:hypothetical protein